MGRWEERTQKELFITWALQCHFVPSPTPLQLSYFFSLGCLFLSVMSWPLFCLSSSIIISCHRFLSSLSHFRSLFLFLCLEKKRSGNKAINKKSTVVSVVPHYGFFEFLQPYDLQVSNQCSKLSILPDSFPWQRWHWQVHICTLKKIQNGSSWSVRRQIKQV